MRLAVENSHWRDKEGALNEFGMIDNILEPLAHTIRKQQDLNIEIQQNTGILFVFFQSLVHLM